MLCPHNTHKCGHRNVLHKPDTLKSTRGWYLHAHKQCSIIYTHCIYMYKYTAWVSSHGNAYIGLALCRGECELWFWILKVCNVYALSRREPAHIHNNTCMDMQIMCGGYKVISLSLSLLLYAQDIHLQCVVSYIQDCTLIRGNHNHSGESCPPQYHIKN